MCWSKIDRELWERELAERETPRPIFVDEPAPEEVEPQADDAEQRDDELVRV